MDESRMAKSSTRSALILGDDSRSCLSVVRSLGRAGIDVDVAAVSTDSPVFSSKFIRNKYEIPNYDSDADHWVSALKGILAGRRYQVVIPCSDRYLLPVVAELHRLSGTSAIFAVPNPVASKVQ